MHNTITDGVGGVRLSMQFLDLSPDAPDPEEVEDPAWVPERGALDVLTEALGHNVRRQLGRLQRSVVGGASLFTHPTRAAGMATDTTETARSLWRQLAV